MMAKQTSPISKKNVTILQALRYLNKEQRSNLLKTSDTALVKCICECVLNILCGNIYVNNKDKKKIKKFTKTLRKLCKSKGTLQNKKKIIVQEGGFIGPMLSVLSSLHVSLFTGSN